jgi:C_GCAxxG_C_C family probable redox protein
MDSLSVKLHDEGMNCSKSIFKAICQRQNKEVSGDCLKVFDAISSGFGVGAFCSAIIGALCALSVFFDEDEMQYIRLALLSDFKERFNSFDCGKIGVTEESCYEILEFLENWACQKIWDKKDNLPLEY